MNEQYRDIIEIRTPVKANGSNFKNDYNANEGFVFRNITSEHLKLENFLLEMKLLIVFFMLIELKEILLLIILLVF